MEFNWKNRFLEASKIYGEISLLNSLSSITWLLYPVIIGLFFWTFISNYPIAGTLSLIGFLGLFFGPGLYYIHKRYRYKKANNLYPVASEVKSSKLYFSDQERVERAEEIYRNIKEANSIIEVRKKALKRFMSELKKSDIYKNKSMKPRKGKVIVDDMESYKHEIKLQLIRKKALEKELRDVLQCVSGKSSIVIPDQILKTYPHLK